MRDVELEYGAGVLNASDIAQVSRQIPEAKAAESNEWGAPSQETIEKMEAFYARLTPKDRAIIDMARSHRVRRRGNVKGVKEDK